MKRRVAVITGCRADFGLLYHPMKEMQRRPELELQVIVTGIHLVPQHGMSVREVEAAGLPIAARVAPVHDEDTGRAMAANVGHMLEGIVEALDVLSPDLVVVLGDRGEMLAGALAAVHLNVRVVHIHGGEVTGTVDEMVRHAITKLAHIHLVSTEAHKVRVVRMGEDPAHVYVVGAPGLDWIRTTPLLDRQTVCERLGIPAESPYLLATLHPVTTEVDQSGWQMEQCLMALESSGYPVVMTYPNTDAGGQAMSSVLESWRERPFLRLYRNLGSRLYWSAMAHALAVVGNSSSGVIEAPSLGVPVVDIGSRQNGRARAPNVIHAGHRAEEIAEGLQKATGDSAFRSNARSVTNPYGDGRSGPRIARLLASMELEPVPVQKRLTY